MRTTLLASCLLILSFGVVGCDDAKKVDDPAVTPAPTVTPAPVEPGKGGEMSGPGGGMSGPATDKKPDAPTDPVTPAPTPAEPK